MRVRGWLALALALVSAPASADTLVDHVNGITLTADGRVEHFAAMVIGNDGRVVSLLQPRDRRPRADYAVDGHGRTLLPGLIADDLRLMPLALAAITPPSAGQLPPPRPEDRDLALVTIQPQLFARGITTVADMGTTIEDWQTWRRAGDEGRLAVRILAQAASVPAMALIAGPRPTPWLYDDRLRLAGLLIEMPASPGPAAEVQAKNLMSRAAMDHFQPIVRVQDAAGEASVARAVEELSQTYTGDRRWRTLVGPSPAALPDVFAAMAGSVDRIAVLRRYTLDAAQGLFAEGRIGRLTQGARADFVLVDFDPELASTDELRAGRVLETWVGGRKVWARVVASAAPAAQGAERSPDPTGQR